jgi:hypothetical protein
MTQREHYQIDPSHHAAIARRDDEGGAAAPVRNGTDLEGSENRRSKRRAGARAFNVDQDSDEDQHILDCLGAAVMMRWGTLPTKIQRELFERATSLPTSRRGPS